ncbi:MAG: OmpA family protein [Prevotella sp.]|nr:OmpA family protein [Prevotella sp.]
MKKLLIILALASCSVAVMSQSEIPTERHSVSTNPFFSNWFFQANVAGSAFYSNTESGRGFAKSPFKDFRNNLGFSVALGKWFTPGLGLRTKFNGAWGRAVISEDKDVNATKYWTLNEQVLFNLSNMLYGYSETRVWNFIPYAGGGVGRNMSRNTYAMGLTAGLLNQWRLSRKVALNLDVSFGVYEPDLDGVTKPGLDASRNFTAKDRVLNVELGLTYKFGKGTWKKTPDLEAVYALYQSEIDALNAQLADAYAENDDLRSQLDNGDQMLDGPGMVYTPPVVTVMSFFFERGSSQLLRQQDFVNLKTIAEAVIQRNAEVTIEGYADSNTGNVERNQQLSQQRAETVAAALQTLGVPSNNMHIVAKGGVDLLTPPENNRRVIVTF